MTDTLLVELGTEELPPRALPTLSEAFGAGVEQGLRGANLAFEDVEVHATPRRLAVSVTALAAQQPDRIEQRRGPAVKAAFDEEGAPTKAALGFARSCGVPVEELGRAREGKGEWLSHEVAIAGEPTVEIVPGVIAGALNALPIPKRMRWGDRSVEFVRPVHWLVVLYGSEVVPCEILDLQSARTTRGHRFHHPDSIEIRHASDYVEILERTGRVIVNFDTRRKRVRAGIEACARERHTTAMISPELLDEVTALVEWPVPIYGGFDEHFLELPDEVLIAAMQDHQKYFPVTADGALLVNHFITVCNIESSDPATVRDGNERVIRPRLADAGFFWRTDRSRPLASRLPELEAVLFEKRLGSLHDKTARVERVAAETADDFGADVSTVARAAGLSRCDLLTDMVAEFPELQGTMGRHYALADGEPEAVCNAIGEFYRPRFSGDALPETPAGQCIAVADKLDTLVGIFGIGSAPTGDKDPYALRRAAIGVIRILIENSIPLDLRRAIGASVDAHSGLTLADSTASQVFDFVRDRLRAYYLDKGVSPDVCDAVFANDPAAPLDASRRVDAVIRFRSLDAAVSLAAANKRIANLLKKAGRATDTRVERELLVEAEEIALMDRHDEIAPAAARLFEDGEYTSYMELIAGLREAVDSFFEHVMVMCEDERLRRNRIALLAALHSLFTRVADIARLN